MIVGFDHTAIFVSDLRRSLELYRCCFRAEVVRQVDLPDLQLSMADIQIGQGPIELIEKRTSDFRGFHHIAFRTVGIRSEWARLEETSRILPVTPPKRAVSGAGEVAFFLDPDRTRIELIERPDIRHAAREAASGADPVSVSLCAADLTSSLGFYTHHLGAEQVRLAAPTDGHPRVCFLKSGSDILRMSEFLDSSVQGLPGIDHVALIASDLGGEAERLRAYPEFTIIPDAMESIRRAGRFTALGPERTKFVFYQSPG